MPDIDPLVYAYGFVAAASLTLSVVLIVGAFRNHFRYHMARPVVWAQSVMFSSLFIYFTIRLYGVVLRTGGSVDAYLALSTSVAWYASAYFITASIIGVAVTLLLAYPASRR